MGFDPDSIARHLEANTALMRLLVVDTAGSTPRESGASMLVWHDGIAGTIGGGALEHEATRHARARLKAGITEPTLRKFPLGPGLGQCCGGSLTMLFETCTPDMLNAAQAMLSRQGLYARPINRCAPAMNEDISSAILAVQEMSSPPAVVRIRDWIIEPDGRTATDLWIYGAGHVGRALISILHQSPAFALTWIDFAADRFPADTPVGTDVLIVRDPADATAYVRPGTECLVLTHSHDLDLEICHRLLTRDCAGIGLIGSATKWKRFQKRLLAMGHTEEAVNQIICPIGDPALGKDPWSIALGVASALVRSRSDRTAAR